MGKTPRSKKRAPLTGKAKVQKKKSVVFDADARKEYLLGFRKRKAERRKFGLDMQALKDKRARQQEKKERREVIQEKYTSAMKMKRDRMRGHAFVEDEELLELGMSDAEAKRAAKRMRASLGDDLETGTEGEAKRTDAFEDQYTQQKFGEGVTVTTVFGLDALDDTAAAAGGNGGGGDDDDDDEEEEEDEAVLLAAAEERRKRLAKKNANPYDGLTTFQRIQLKSKGNLPSKRRHKGQKGQKRGDFAADKRRVGREKTKGVKRRSALKNNLKGRARK